MIPLFIWILCPADIVYLIKIDILGSRIKVMKKWCLRIFIWRYKGICLLYSPHMWRWSWVKFYVPDRETVFSTYVEVILTMHQFLSLGLSILHVCGGDPNPKDKIPHELGYSPRMWRWSLKNALIVNDDEVFSTYVEVIPELKSALAPILSILHVCGGDPSFNHRWKFSCWYSPRMWRWSWSTLTSAGIFKVFSTYVEVIPIFKTSNSH